jgi:hypothetical protein
MFLTKWTVLASALFLLSSCQTSVAPASSRSSAVRCVPGRQLHCPCPSGASGGQSCQSNGTFGPCTCKAYSAKPTILAAPVITTTPVPSRSPTAQSAAPQHDNFPTLRPDDPSPCLTGGSSVVIVGDQDDVVSRGAKVKITGIFASFFYSRRLIITAMPANFFASEQASLTFDAQDWGPPLSVGTYVVPSRVRDTPRKGGGLRIGYSNHACNDAYGSFHVHELMTRGSDVVRFTATFEQHCPDSPGKLIGCVHVENSAVEPAPLRTRVPTSSRTSKGEAP